MEFYIFYGNKYLKLFFARFLSKDIYSFHSYRISLALEYGKI